MALRGVYKNMDGSIGIIVPVDEVLDLVGVTALMEKDVPVGLPYWIVDASVIPTDREYRSAWEVDEAMGEPHGFGGESNEFDAELLAAYYAGVNA